MHTSTALILVALAARPASASAQTTEELISEGVRLRREGQDAEALARFRAAHAASPSPRSLAQIALAEQALGRWAAAATHLRGAIDAPDDWVCGREAALREAWNLIRQHVTRLAPPPGCSTTSPETPLGLLTFVTRGEPVRLRVACADATATITVTPTLETLELARPAPEPPTRPAPRSPHVALPPAGPLHPVATSLGPPHPSAWALGAVGIAGAGIAVALIAVRNQVAGDFNGPNCTPGTLSRGEACGHLRDQVGDLEAWTATSAALGAACLAAGVAVGIVARRRVGVGFAATSEGFSVSIGARL